MINNNIPIVPTFVFVKNFSLLMSLFPFLQSPDSYTT